MAIQSAKYKNPSAAVLAILGKNSFSKSTFAYKFGGGLDIRLSPKIDLRAIQFDISSSGSNSSGNRQGNYRIGFGIAFH